MAKLLQMVYDELLHQKKVKSKKDFSEQLQNNAGYITRESQKEGCPPKTIRLKLIRKFGISGEWLDSDGTKGEMFDSRVNVKQRNENDGDFKIDDVGQKTESASFARNSNEDAIYIQEVAVSIRELAASFNVLAKTNDRLVSIIEQLIPKKV